MGFAWRKLRFCYGTNGKKATMLCTASVEEVIDKYYLSQIERLESEKTEEKELLKKIKIQTRRTRTS